MVLAGLAVAGTLYGAYNQYQSGKQQQRTAERRASLLNQQANEALERGLINRELFARKGEQTLASQQSSFAAMGIDIGSGSPLLMAQYTANAIAEELVTMSREADYEAMAIRNEAQFTRDSGADAARAGRINAFGTVLSGSATAYKAYKG